MNLTSPVLHGMAQAAEIPGSTVTSLVKTIAFGSGLLADDSPNGPLGLVMSGLAGVAAALAVAIVLTVYFRTGYRSGRDILRHGVATAAVLGLLAFVVSDMRNAALAYLGINPARPAVEFEIRLPKASLSASSVSTSAETQVELLTDRNQTLAQLQGAVEFAGDGRSILKGSVPLKFRTTDRVVVLNLPGERQYRFKLRLAASPTPSGQFGPWHLADRVTDAADALHDAFAIRYRVL